MLNPVPRLDRLRTLRNALVALKGPLANDPALQANLQRHLFNEATQTRVLGQLSSASVQKACLVPLDEGI
nr:type VI secretion system contractile sheath small subunit [Pseudomonas sp. ICMP 460]